MFAFPKGPYRVAAATILFPEEPYDPSSPLRSLLAWKVLDLRLNFNASLRAPSTRPTACEEASASRARGSTLKEVGFLQMLRDRLAARRELHREHLLDRELKREQAEAREGIGHPLPAQNEDPPAKD